MNDEDRLEFASNRSMTILTHVRMDFEELAKDYFAKNKTHNGIIIVFPHSPQEIAQRLIVILNNFTQDEMKN